MEIPVDHEGVHLDGHLDIVGDYSIFLAVLDGIHGSNECRNVTSGLPWEIFVDRPEIPLAAPPDGLVDVARAAVVGRDGKVPVSEKVVRVFEVAGRSIGRLEGVEPFIDIGVDLQSVTLRCLGHELPHALSSCP